MHHLHDSSCACSRRSFLGASIGCGAYLTLAMAAGTALTRRAFAAAPAGAVLKAEPFARVEKIAEGVWAIVSTPFTGEKPDMRTVSNGGIIAGKEGVALVEGLNTPEGAAWMSGLAKELTGRAPTHVVVTHFHGDHSGGLAGYLGGDKPPTIIGTATTRNLIAERYGKSPTVESLGDRLKADQVTFSTGRIVLPDTVIVRADSAHTIDLGGRTVRLTQRMGHTPSDLVIEVADPRVVWTGDLVFNGMFPNFADSIPSLLGRHCKEMLSDPDTLYVPGHGSCADAAALKPYLAMLEDVERAARDAFAKGTPASEAWKTYEIPKSLGEWRRFRPNVYQFAFEAWEKELRGG